MRQVFNLFFYDAITGIKIKLRRAACMQEHKFAYGLFIASAATGAALGAVAAVQALRHPLSKELEAKWKETNREFEAKWEKTTTGWIKEMKISEDLIRKTMMFLYGDFTEGEAESRASFDPFPDIKSIQEDPSSEQTKKRRL